MGKKGGGADSGKENAPEASPKKNAEPRKDAEPKKEAKGKKETGQGDKKELTQGGGLSKLRPQKRRCVFFCAYVAFCAWLVGTYDACTVKGKKRDCGYSGISPSECMTFACFTKGGGELLKKTVKIESKGGPLGLRVEEDTDGSWLTVSAVTTGAIADYNAQADAEDRVLVGDSISKVGSNTGAKKMKKALSDPGKAVELELRRSKLPSYLRWIRSGGKPGVLEKVLTSPGFEKWSRSASVIGGGGLLCWALSGYPPASLPIYYFSLSGATAFALARCCHDENVGGGVPHCYKGNSPKVEDAVMESAAKTRDVVAKLYKDIAKDPNKYFKTFFDFKF